jgi:hypothetical protein
MKAISVSVTSVTITITHLQNLGLSSNNGMKDAEQVVEN